MPPSPPPAAAQSPSPKLFTPLKQLCSVRNAATECSYAVSGENDCRVSLDYCTPWPWTRPWAPASSSNPRKFLALRSFLKTPKLSRIISSSHKQTLKWSPIVNSRVNFSNIHCACLSTCLRKEQTKQNGSFSAIRGHFSASQPYHTALCAQIPQYHTVPYYTSTGCQWKPIPYHNTLPHTIQFPTLPDQFGPNRMDPSRPFTVIFLRPPLTFRAFYNSLGSSTVTKRNTAEGQGRKNDKETVVEYVGLETTLLMIGQTGASHRSLLSDGRTWPTTAPAPGTPSSSSTFVPLLI